MPDGQIVEKTLDHMKNRFLQTFTKISYDESMTLAKSVDDDNNHFTCLAGESQDLYEDDSNEPTIGDFWDSMTQVIIEHMSNRNDKKLSDK